MGTSVNVNLFDKHLIVIANWGKQKTSKYYCKRMFEINK